MIIKIVKQEDYNIIFYDELGATVRFSVGELIELVNELKEVDR